METSEFKKINFNSLFFKCLGSDVFAVILFIILFEFLLIDFISYSLFTEMESDSARIKKTLLQISLSIPFSVMTYVFIQWKLGLTYKLTLEENFLKFLSSNFLEWAITNLRVFARVIMFTFLLIIPGLIESMRLSFSSYNTLFNKKMSDEAYDPVIDSRKKIDPFSIEILFLLNFTMLIPLFLSLPFAEKTFMTEPIMKIFHAVSVTVGLILSQTYIFYKFSNYYSLEELNLTREEIKGE